MKHIEFFNNGFDKTVQEKIQPENWPYIGYSPNNGFMFTMVPEPPQMIDLGLSVKWADRNVGAYSPEDNGLYFSWGNVEGHAVGKNGNTMDGYSFSEDAYYKTPGYNYNGTTLDAAHDAATVNIGEEWRMPTKDEINELIENTDQYYIDEDDRIIDKSKLDGANLCSICFVKKNEEFNYNNRTNFIEIPFVGFCNGSFLHGEGIGCIVWSSSAYKRTTGYVLIGNVEGIYCNAEDQGYLGLSVRGVHA